MKSMLLGLAFVSAVSCTAAESKAPVMQPVENDVHFVTPRSPEDGKRTLPQAVSQQKPIRPAKWRRYPDIAGKAHIAFVVGKDGSVVEAQVKRANDIAFGEAAVAAVKKWKFRPATRNGDPIECR